MHVALCNWCTLVQEDLLCATSLDVGWKTCQKCWRLECVENCLCQIVSYPHCMFSIFLIFQACTPRAQYTKLLPAITITFSSAILQFSNLDTLRLISTGQVVSCRRVEPSGIWALSRVMCFLCFLCHSDFDITSSFHKFISACYPLRNANTLSFHAAHALVIKRWLPEIFQWRAFAKGGWLDLGMGIPHWRSGQSPPPSFSPLMRYVRLCPVETAAKC